ncbi:uncharacterized protein LOC110224411 [Arabidopsis lyrata subsp. lyrata]|uniref:uncharacterized protein LOC110224411 n=1 Tax=Arabidopsis lyrata subsp. lyrata TaxID=81972 RepID=UPI000A29B52D|nr:uncharacterized protein LOC110224411 [Arabidopsis lyrata subsp. lyrata]|eukprot:XP_020866126.1 uncharacterized protein LOC110224411 [Arabidopsis lyrata subsp. lyrata]
MVLMISKGSDLMDHPKNIFNRSKQVFGLDPYQSTYTFDTEYRVTWQHLIGSAFSLKAEKKKKHFCHSSLSLGRKPKNFRRFLIGTLLRRFLLSSADTLSLPKAEAEEEQQTILLRCRRRDPQKQVSEDVVVEYVPEQPELEDGFDDEFRNIFDKTLVSKEKIFAASCRRTSVITMKPGLEMTSKIICKYKMASTSKRR